MSRALAIAVLFVGLLLASFHSVEQLTDVSWGRYGVALGAALIGALLVRATREDRGGGILIINVQIILSSLTMLAAKLKNFGPEKRAELGVHGIHAFIDEHLIPDVDRFLNTRETLISKHGLEAYAAVMDAFSEGERALNRAWSASVDGYVDEVDDCLGLARARFEEALRLVKEAERS